MTLRVVGIADASLFPARVCFDWYTAITFESYDKGYLPGARTIFVRSRKTHLLELECAPNSMILRGFIWAMGENLIVPGFPQDLQSTPGLPILELPANTLFPDEPNTSEEVKLPAVLCQPGRHIDIRIGTAKTFDSCISHGRIRFLIHGDELVGLRVVDLTDEERSGLEAYIARRVAPE